MYDTGTALKLFRDGVAAAAAPIHGVRRLKCRATGQGCHAGARQGSPRGSGSSARGSGSSARGSGSSARGGCARGSCARGSSTWV